MMTPVCLANIAVGLNTKQEQTVVLGKIPTDVRHSHNSRGHRGAH